MKQDIALVLLLSALLVSGSGCGGGDNRYPAPRADTRADSIVTRAGTFEIGSKKYAADFGTITVPENRSKPASRIINIPFLRIHSHSQNPAEPVFGFAGGPGASNMSWDPGKASAFLPKHDFVLVGYRGVDGSTVLDCPEVAEAFKGDGDILGGKSMERIARAWGTDAESLAARGVDLDGYTMLEVIEDNESVRRALGYKLVDLLSESYGTRVAYLYGLKHPESIYRSAMIGVNPPGCFVWENGPTDELLRRYSALWSRDSAMSSKTTDLYAAMQRVLNGMPRRWFVFPIDPGKVRVVTFALLFQRSTAAMVFDAYAAADRGDASGLALMSFSYGFVVPSMATWGDLASKAVSADFNPARNYTSDMDPSDTPLGSPMSKMLWGPMTYGHWPVEQLPTQYLRARASDVETLLLSGSVDFSTPPQNATEKLLPYLAKGRQVILSECGHVNDVWYAKPGNARLMLTSFYDTGVPDTSLNTYVPMDFNVKWGFPAIAKASLGGIVFIIMAVVAVPVWIIRRRRVRKSSEASFNRTGP